MSKRAKSLLDIMSDQIRKRPVRIVPTRPLLTSDRFRHLYFKRRLKHEEAY